MLCYIWLEKRGVFIKKYINWKLISDNKVIINLENIECEFENNVIKYYEDIHTLNIIDLNEDLYIRENTDFLFRIDFKNKIFNYILKENNISIEQNLEATITKDNNIDLKYNLGEENKEIIIQLL